MEMESPPPKASYARMYSFEIIEQSKRLGADWRSYLLEHLRAGGTEIWLDLRSVRWLRFLMWFGFLAWIAGIIIAILFACFRSLLAIGYSYDGYAVSPARSCLPDGSFSLTPGTYDMWRPSGFFQITLGFGHLPFGKAKFYDIAFDIVVGRGGQVLLAFVSGRVFAGYITSQMDVTPVSYGTYKTVFLREGPTFWSTIGLIREFICYRALNSKTAMTWMILSATFIVAFPTLASAMSGYSGNSVPFVRDPDTQNLLLWKDFSQVDYIVQDGGRIGLGDGFTLTEKEEDCYRLDPAQSSSYYPYETDRSDPYGSAAWNNSICKIRLDISEYVRTNGFFGLQKSNSSYRNYTLPSPVLNITAFYVPRYSSINGLSTNIYGNNWTDPRTGEQPFRNKSQMAYASTNSDQTFPSLYVSNNGVCQPSATYKWGFSFLILFITLICLFVWTIGTYILWLKTHLALRSRSTKDVAGEYKAVVELAESLTSSFRSLGEKPETLREGQIRRRIRKDLNGGKMLYQSPLRGEPYTFWGGFKRWCKRDKWWILALLTATFVISITGAYAQFGLLIFTAFVFSGMVCARWICTTGRSMGFMIAIFVVCGVIVAPATTANMSGGYNHFYG